MVSTASDLARSLMQEAADVAGSDDWGDVGFLPALQRLLASAMPTVSAEGRQVLRRVVVRRLANRLYVQAYLRAHPDTAARPLPVAVVITGLPRTGTTALHNLLALDPANRVLRLWEALHPVPPDPATGFTRAELVRQAERWLARMHELVPGFRAIHPTSTTGPEECDLLLQNEFASQHFDDMFDAPAYSSWLYETRLTRQYSYYALQLRVLSPDEGPAWVLKSPSHLAHLDSVLAVLPDAVVVHCHRHPNEAIASWASLIRAVRSPHHDKVPPRAVGRQVVPRATAAMSRALLARQDEEGRFLDLPYRLILEHPVDAVRLVYARLDRSLSSDVEAAMRRWVGVNRQHLHGPHRYDLAVFGLTEGEVEAHFSSYLASFSALLTG